MRRLGQGARDVPHEVRRDGLALGLIIVANLDPHSVRETLVHLDLTQFGLQPEDSFTATELITGAEWAWSRDNFVRLDAFTEPVHVIAIDHATVRHSPIRPGSA